MASVVIPEVKLDERIQEGAGELYREWRAARDEAYPAPPVRSIRFTHDPFWRERVLSIECARRCNHPVWSVVRVLFVTASLSGFWTFFVNQR